MTLTYGSLFTGVGGFDLGFDQQGYEGKWQAEWDQHCQQTLQHHWPHIPHHLDVRDINGAQLQPVDVITYGSPCQDLSLAGRQKGLAGDRSSMFHEAVRIIKEMRNATAGIYPRIAIWENVTGALTSNHGRDFHTVLTSLDHIGALAQWWYVLDAQKFGVAQRRRRVFLITVFDPAIATKLGTGQILDLSESSTRNPKTSQPTQQTTATDVDRSVEPNHQQHVAFQIHHDDIRIQKPVISAVTALWGTGGNNATMVAQHLAFDTKFGSNANVFNDISPTLKASQGAPTVATELIVRKLTPIECERLMGWPDNHTLHRADGKTNSDNQRYKMCGNGVVTPVANWIAKQLKQHLQP